MSGSAGMSATATPSSRTRKVPVAVTRPIVAASSSHFSRISRTESSRPASATTSIRSCDSERRISYGVIPCSRTGTRATSITTPVPDRPAISTPLEVSPAAPMSWIPTMCPLAISSSEASRSSFSVKGSPTCTCCRLASSSPSESSSDAKVAPWIPSRPVRAPTAMSVLPTPSAVCYRPPKISQKWPSKIAHLQGRAVAAVGGWVRGWRVFRGRIGNLASPLNRGGAVIGREKRVLLRHYLEQGMSKAAIARQLRISRRTVYNWMEAGELDRGVDDKAVRYRPRAPLPSKLDPFREIIRTRLADYPELSAVRLFEEVKMAGYPGGYGQVKRYVRAVRPRDPVEPVVRFETPPGHQAQVDFAEFRLPWGKRHALIVVLGYSRRMWLRFYERQTMMVVIRGIEESFPYLGGVPVELLFDQMKAVVIADGRAGGGCVVANPEFRGFSDHWGFRIRTCRPYRAQTKGKVERPIRYVRNNFFYGRDFVSDDDLNARVGRWLDEVANVRVHGTLKECVSDRFERERPLLGPLAFRPYSPVVPRPEPPESPGRETDERTLPKVDVEQRALRKYAFGEEGAS